MAMLVVMPSRHVRCHRSSGGHRGGGGGGSQLSLVVLLLPPPPLLPFVSVARLASYPIGEGLLCCKLQFANGGGGVVPLRLLLLATIDNNNEGAARLVCRQLCCACRE